MHIFRIKNLIVALTLLLISCGSPKEKYTLNVKTTNKELDKAYIYSYDLSRDKTLIDSTNVLDGSFQYSSFNANDSLQAYFFNFDKNQRGGYFFLIKNGIILSMDIGEEYNIALSGSNYAEDFNKYYAAKQQEIDIIKQIVPIYQNQELTEEQLQDELLKVRKTMEAQKADFLDFLSSITNHDLKAFLVLEEISTQSVIEKPEFELYVNTLTPEDLNTKYGKRIGFIMTHFDAYKLYMDGGYAGFLNIKKQYKQLSKADKECEYGTKVKASIEKLEQLLYGKEPPLIKAKTIDGTAFSLSDINSKLILIDFWASWCGPCRMENPHYKKLYSEFHGKGLTIVGYSLDTDVEKWKKAVEDDELDWINISNLKKQREDSILINYQINAVPSNIIIKDGVIAARNLFGPELDDFIYQNIDN